MNRERKKNGHVGPTQKNKNPKRGRQCVMDGKGREAVAFFF